jgi:hypothetical protein
MDDAPDAAAPEAEPIDMTAVASVALSAVSFLTLLKLADRRDRSPARALGLFLATTAESITGTVLGAQAIGRAREVGRPNKNLLFGAGGLVLGLITSVLNVNWMRTRRRL